MSASNGRVGAEFSMLPLIAPIASKAAADVSAQDLRERLREARHGQLLARELLCGCCAAKAKLSPNCCSTARALKEQYRPGVITYSRKVFIPLTNFAAIIAATVPFAAIRVGRARTP